MKLRKKPVFKAIYQLLKPRQAEKPLTGIEALSQQAAKGDPQSQYALGELYRAGKGVPQDNACAAKWFLLAAEQGHMEAQHRIAELYRLGEGVPLDFNEAKKWLFKAALKQNARKTDITDEDENLPLGGKDFDAAFGKLKAPALETLWFLMILVLSFAIAFPIVGVECDASGCSRILSWVLVSDVPFMALLALRDLAHQRLIYRAILPGFLFLSLVHLVFWSWLQTEDEEIFLQSAHRWALFFAYIAVYSTYRNAADLSHEARRILVKRILVISVPIIGALLAWQMT